MPPVNRRTSDIGIAGRSDPSIPQPATAIWLRRGPMPKVIQSDRMRVSHDCRLLRGRGEKPIQGGSCVGFAHSTTPNALYTRSRSVATSVATGRVRGGFAAGVPRVLHAVFPDEYADSQRVRIVYA